MLKFCLVAVLFFTNFVFSQDIQTVQKEIDINIWKPFKAAFETLNETALNNLYADEVLRVTSNGIDTDNKFKAKNEKRFAANRASNTSMQLDFWFDSRHTNAHTSYEVGFYRIRSTNSDRQNDFYGQFHIVLKKQNGFWKITQDWDTATINGRTITVADFEKQRPIQLE